MIKTIVFDLNGVIWKRRPFNQAFFELLSQTVNLHPKTVRSKYNQVASLFQLDKLKLNHWLKTEFNLDKDQLETFNFNLQKVFKAHYQTNFYPKALALIRLLQTNGFTIGCLTNSENFLIDLFTKAGLFCNFDFKVASSIVGFKKPNQKIFKQIFKIGNWKPSQVLFIDNQKSNLLAAQKLGINTIHFKSYKALAPKLDKILF